MKKRFVVIVSIIALLTMVSIAIANSPWVDFEAYFEGIEFIDAFYQNEDGIWVAEATTTGDATFYFDEGEIEATFELHSVALFVHGLEDPDSAVIKAEIWIYDADSDGNFFCHGHGIGHFGKLNTVKASGEWKNQKIRGEYETLGDPDGEGPLNFSATLSGEWKNPDL